MQHKSSGPWTQGCPRVPDPAGMELERGCPPGFRGLRSAPHSRATVLAGGDQPHGSSKNPPRPGFCPQSAVSSSGVGPCGRAGPVPAGRAQAARASPAAGSHRIALCGHSGRPQRPSPGAHGALELGTAEGGGQGGPERAGSRTPTSCPEATGGPRSGGPSAGPGAAGSTSPAGCPPAGAGPAPPPPRAAAQWRPAGRRVLPGRLGAPPFRAGASVSAGVT